MKNLKSIFFPMACIILMMALMTITPEAKADANLMENGSVVYAWIKNPDDLKNYIEDEGVYASYDYLQKEELSNIYKIVLDEPGQLLFAPLSAERARLELFSDYKLNSSIGKMDSIENSREGFTSFSLEAGTYYYRSHHLYNSSVGGITVFLGFIPDSSVLHDNSTQATITYPEISLIPVSSADELASYIDNDGEPSSSEHIADVEDDRTQTYQFTVTEKGTLYVSPIATIGDYVEISLFGNQDLSSRLLYQKCGLSSYDSIYSIDLNPGTYYYFIDRWNSYFETDVYAFLGFAPESETNQQDRYFSDTSAENAFDIPHVHSEEDFRQLISNENYTLKDEIKYGENSSVRSFTLTEQSFVYMYLKSVGVQDRTYRGYLYSDKSQISLVGEYDITDKAIQTYILDAGTYYYYTYNYLGLKNNAAYTYFGYTPVSDVIRIESITPSDDHSTASVIFSIDEKYNPDQYRAQVRVEQGVIKARSVLNTEIWKDQARDNAIESHEFIATENGVYTARISGNGLSPYLLTFEVTGINSESEESEQTSDDSQQIPAESPDAEPAEPVISEQEPAAESATMNASEMRKYIRMLEDQIEDLGLELPELSASDTQEEYMKKLEKVLQDNGYDF